MLKRLRDKWGIRSNSQFWLIMLVFAISGTSSMFVKIPLFALLGFDDLTQTWIKVLVYIVAITPAYFALLLFYAFVFGQFRFFWSFTKKIFGRFAGVKKIFFL